jgi:predicted hydrocarbon binding protein/DNA-binding HxlR family transcriptional regulator
MGHMTVNKKVNSNKPLQYKIFSSNNKIDVVKGQVKVQILDALCEKNMSFNEIVELTGKAKPTVSQHLRELVDDDLIRSTKDPQDARRKIFCINAEFIGELSKDKEQKFDIDDYFSKLPQLKDPFEFYRLILRSLRAEFWNEGINIDPILHKAGKRVGDVFYEELKNDDLNKLLENLAKFWESKQLGQIEVKTFDPLTLCVYDCFECKDLPEIGEPACSFDSGVLDSIFSKHFKRNITTIENECFAMGNECCSFVID